MSAHTPDSWNVLRIEMEDGTALDRVLGAWSGGYLDGDSWRMNSGITEVREDASSYWFHGTSGSVYVCHKDGEGLRGYGARVLATLLEQHPDRITLIEAKELA